MDPYGATVTFFQATDGAGRTSLRARITVYETANPRSMLDPQNTYGVEGTFTSVPSGDHGEPVFVNARKALATLGYRPTSDFRSDQYRRDIFSVELRARDPRITATSTHADEDFAGADLVGEALQSSSFVRARMTKARLDHADLSSADLSGADLRDASLLGTKMRGTRLRGADLSRCATDGSTVIEGADLSGAVLQETSLRGVISGCSFDNADWRGSTMPSIATRSNFAGVDLRTTTITGCIVSGSRFASAQLPPLDEMTDVSWTPETAWPEHLRNEIVARSLQMRGPAANGTDSGLYELNPTKDRREQFGNAPPPRRRGWFRGRT